MKKLLTLALICSSIMAHAQEFMNYRPDAVIYGDDHRLEVYESLTHYQSWARSAATMVSKEKISPLSNGLNLLEQVTLEELMKKEGDSDISFCPEEKFVHQPNPGMCSGFLIAPDLILTAGHCVGVDNFCSEYKWVFDFKLTSNDEAGKNIPAHNIYSCKQVITHTLNMDLGLDYGLVQLDRKVVGRTPLKVRTQGRIRNQENLVIIGNPSGLPLKVAAGARVRDNDHPFYFSANLDSFQGNSGSAVFNQNSGVVEGILVRGENDYVLNSDMMCIESNKCEDEECRGEDATRTTSIPEIALMPLLHKAAAENDVAAIKRILSLEIWIDMNGEDGQSALLKAAKAGAASSLEYLVQSNASVKMSDINGDSALHHLARVLKPDQEVSLKLLINSGADLELRNNQNETPLMSAKKARNKRAMKMLVRAGANKKVLPWWEEILY